MSTRSMVLIVAGLLAVACVVATPAATVLIQAPTPAADILPLMDTAAPERAEPTSTTAVAPVADPDALDPSPPAQPVRLIFIHHSSGENWLADGNGGLGLALMDNHYFVSDTNYGWGPNDPLLGGPIGDNTDIGHWWNWFVGPAQGSILQALFAENEQHAEYTRLTDDPGGANQIVMFKSCFPNSALGGSPHDPPATGKNPLQGQASGSEHYTVANAKRLYADLLPFFESRPETLFVAVTAPPLLAADTSPEQAANARAFNRWLTTEWLAGYPLPNVAVFDFYNVLTSNGGNAAVNDADSSGGNHHRFRNGRIEYVTDQGSDASAYALEGDSHPTPAGNQKATAEFVPLLNVFTHRWLGAR